MTHPPADDGRELGTRHLVESARPGDAERVPAVRGIAWIVVGLVVLLGLVLYFVYARRLTPLLG